jgi:diketogulonate reductase-like aldo/keto reductase
MDKPNRIRDRFPAKGRKLTEEEKRRVEELYKKYEGKEIHWPFPKPIENNT